MQTDQQTCPLDDLQLLLENQIEMFRKSNFTAVDALAAKADQLVSQLSKTSQFHQPQFDLKRQKLIKLYKTLELMIQAGKYTVSKQLQEIEKGKKTLQKYRIST